MTKGYASNLGKNELNFLLGTRNNFKKRTVLQWLKHFLHKYYFSCYILYKVFHYKLCYTSNLYSTNQFPYQYLHFCMILIYYQIDRRRFYFDQNHQIKDAPDIHLLHTCQTMYIEHVYFEFLGQKLCHMSKVYLHNRHQMSGTNAIV